LAGVTQSVADTKTALEAAIADAKATGLTGDAALQKAIDSVAADAQVSKEELLSKLGTTEAALKADFEAGLSGVSSDIAATRSALEIAVRTAIDIGLQGDAAIQAAIDSVAADQQISKQELLAQLGTTETNLRAVMAAGISGVEQQLKDQYASMTAAQKSLANDLVSQGKTFQEAMDAAAKSTAEQIAGVSDDLQKAIDINEAAGMSRDAAISKAVDDVAASVGSTRADLLAQLGATEQSLLDKFQAGQEQTQEQIAGLSQEMQQQYAAMTAAQKAEVESRIQQGQSLENALGTVQQALEAQVTDVESRLSAAIAEAEAMGLSRDQAITAAVNAVASDLNTSREELLSQIGQTEQSLKTQIESGLSGLSGEMQAQYESLTEAQKATADALVAQGETFQNALAAAQAETTGQIEGLTAEMQAQYAALTDAQKATANALVAQGETFQNALTTAQAETTSLINTKTDAINTRIAELVAQGVTQQAATTQAFAEVNAKLGSQGRGPDQSDLDALEAMISGSRPTDLSYDVNNDGRIDSSDLSFLTGIVNQTEGGSGFTAPAGSPWAATGLYGELADAEAARAQDAENQRLAGEAAAAQAATNARNAQLRGVAGSAAQSLQQFAGTAPTLMRQATEQVSDPIYGQGIRPFDFGSPLDVGWFSQSKEKQGSQKGTQTTKMAAGGYLDDLLAEDMSVDDLLKLLS
jgi:predicted RNase H-like HicB family nuclease